MKRIVQSGGGDIDTSRNHEYTNWQAVEEFAKEIAEEIAGEFSEAAPTDATSIALRAKSHTP